MYATPSTIQSLINDIHQYVLKQGGKPSDWYVGICNHTDRLFVDHNVAQDSWWIWRPCVSSVDARAVEKAFLDWGCKGGGGGGSYDTTLVYAYLITNTTRE